MPRTPSLAELIDRHRLLDEALEDWQGAFLSDWNGVHPFVERFLGPGFHRGAASLSNPPRYLYCDDTCGILTAVCELHRKLDGLALAPEHIVAGPGSSSLLVALCLWLVRTGYREVFYIPPLYYTLHYFLRVLGIRLRPVSSKHAFERDFTLHLPALRTTLLVSDPLWYAGRRVPKPVIDAIGHWQEQTGSTVIIDGSFQYMQWSGQRAEHSAVLNPERTFRLVSPAKSLAIPSFRFAYLLHPRRAHREFAFLYDSLVGSVGAADLAFGQRALTVLRSKASNRPLTAFLRATYVRLVNEGLITTSIEPDCGYFVFATLASTADASLAMNEEYFELKGYPEYVRVNLMVARQQYFPSWSSSHHAGADPAQVTSAGS